MWHRGGGSVQQISQQHYGLPSSVRRGGTSTSARLTFSSSTKVLAFTALVLLAWLSLPRPMRYSMLPRDYRRGAIMVSYAYFEKDTIQQFNFDFFLQAGKVPSPTGQEIFWSFVVSTDICGPCGVYLNNLVPQEPLLQIGAKRVLTAKDTVLMFRTENAGMDVGSHNVTLEYLKLKGRLSRYAYYIFINSSTKGPFYPAYMPADWHWTHAFLSRMGQADVHAVGSSLVCLPDIDAGGPGPRLESWAYALDARALQLALRAGAYTVRSCKKCTDDTGIIVGGEYGLSRALLDADMNLATLMSRYVRGVDWRQRRHWSCNDNVHPSRHGTYDGIAFHPYETVFVKSSWHVADPYTKRYSIWKIEHLQNDPGTEGEFNREMYTFAVSDDAIKPNLLEAAYNASRVQQLMRQQKQLAAQLDELKAKAAEEEEREKQHQQKQQAQQQQQQAQAVQAGNQQAQQQVQAGAGTTGAGADSNDAGAVGSQQQAQQQQAQAQPAHDDEHDSHHAELRSGVHVKQEGEPATPALHHVSAHIGGSTL